MNADKKLIETVFSIASDMWQSKALFLSIFDISSLIVLAFLIPAYPV